MVKYVPFKWLCVSILLVVSGFLSLGIGAVYLTPFETVQAMLAGNHFILNEYRIPRVLLAMLVGASLAISGAVIQGIVRNSLASPDVIGITKGASLAAVIVIIVIPQAPVVLLPIASFVGALIVSVILGYLITYRRVSGTTLALVGLAIGAIAMAIVQYLLIRHPMEANDALVWLAGSLFGRNMTHVVALLPWFIFAVPCILALARQLDMLTLGDQLAIGLGVKVKQMKCVLLLLAVILAGASIAVVGGLSFLGLIAPHIAKTLVGQRYRQHIVMSGCIGALILVISDSLARGLHPPIDIPVGVIVAIVGAPYFLWVLRKI